MREVSVNARAAPDGAALAVAESDLARRVRLICRVAVLVMIPVVLYFTTLGTGNLLVERQDGGWSAGFFHAQARSMLRGRLDVDPRDLQAECFERRRRCYGYFGLTPSAVRLPFTPVLQRLGSGATPLFLAAAVLLAYWAALQLVQRALVDQAGPSTREAGLMPVGYAVAAALTLGPGGALLFAVRPAVFEEAAAWGVAFVLLAVSQVWAWSSQPNRRLTLAVAFGIAAANARPTAATACLALGLVALVWGWQQRRSHRQLATALCLALLPGLTAAGVFWLKLRTPVPSVAMNTQVREAPHWRDILERNGGTTSSLIFLPTAMLTYLRPDAVVLQPTWPFFDFRFPSDPILWVPPLPKDGAYVERVTSLTASMPWPCLVTVLVIGCVSIAWPRASRVTRAEAAGLLASTAAMGVLTVTTVGIANRYLVDFFPLMVIGVALGAYLIVPAVRQRPVRATAVGLTALALAIWSIVVVQSLAVRLVFS